MLKLISHNSMLIPKEQFYRLVDVVAANDNRKAGYNYDDSLDDFLELSGILSVY